ncbi:hypothetical protein [Arthrobacter sp. AOP36-C1-22]|uniref:hypothetical protein n=1 Tax=Arthrobacter sp. AOP36-C1-22 TaxID=3457683 RepID=UPI004033F426
MEAVRHALFRPPVSRVVLLADVVRAAMLMSVVVAGVGWGWIQVAVFMLAVLATLIPRALGLRASLDLCVGIASLAAAWSNVFDLYVLLPGWDKFMHAVLGGLIAVLSVVIAQRAGILPPTIQRPGALVVATLVLGLATGAVWELLEWAGHTLIDPGVHVGYQDTMGDLAADGLGALIGGFLLPSLTADPPEPAAPPCSPGQAASPHGPRELP